MLHFTQIVSLDPYLSKHFGCEVQMVAEDVKSGDLTTYAAFSQAMERIVN